jgi:uncharacterized protein (TIGR02687 family)
MKNKIKEALEQKFKNNRIVFWYDSKKELRPEFENIKLSDIEKIEIKNNEFKVKYKILREKPEQKFLLYQEGSQPPLLENWLLDVLLYSEEFHADQHALWLGELGLGMEFLDIISNHHYFFKALKRRQNLKNILNSEDSKKDIKIKMLSVCTFSDPRIDEIIESLIFEYSNNKDEKLQLIENSDLDLFLWEQMKSVYGYKSDLPGIKDFIVKLFKSSYDLVLGNDSQLNPDALVFLKRFKSNIKYQSAFEKLSKECSNILQIEKDLENKDISVLGEVDFFELCDRKILSELTKKIINRTISENEKDNILRQRNQTHWYKNFLDVYSALDYGDRFLRFIYETDLEIESFREGIDKYSKNLYLVDYYYRKYIYHLAKSGQTSFLYNLTEKINNFYSNNFLLTLNNNWQKHVDTCKNWRSAYPDYQRNFFKKRITPFTNNNKKVFVIISDALRYETGAELQSRLRQEDRFEAELFPMLSTIPSYTQLGMAALLPNNQIELSKKNLPNIIVDGQSSQGRENRQKILKNGLSSSVCIKAEEFKNMNKDEIRAMVKENDLVYIYHNRIDNDGDKKESEGRVFEAVEETLEEIVLIIKKLAGNNANNFFVTADHGFLYQDKALEESDFLDEDLSNSNYLYRDRRFLIGENLIDKSGLKTFSCTEAGFEGDFDIQIPKSINRIRLKGSGSRFVHGGASLQEIVVPVLKINKKRQSDTSKVNIEVLGGGSGLITTGQLSVVFYQKEHVTDKIRPRILRCGIYSKNNEPVSDIHLLNFDIESVEPRDREIRKRFVLTKKADELNGEEVYLKLEEPETDTSFFMEYKSFPYIVKKSFTSDFDL